MKTYFLRGRWLNTCFSGNLLRCTSCMSLEFPGALSHETIRHQGRSAGFAPSHAFVITTKKGGMKIQVFLSSSRLTVVTLLFHLSPWSYTVLFVMCLMITPQTPHSLPYLSSVHMDCARTSWAFTLPTQSL